MSECSQVGTVPPGALALSSAESRGEVTWEQQRNRASLGSQSIGWAGQRGGDLSHLIPARDVGREASLVGILSFSLSSRVSFLPVPPFFKPSIVSLQLGLLALNPSATLVSLAV